MTISPSIFRSEVPAEPYDTYSLVRDAIIQRRFTDAISQIPFLSSQQLGELDTDGSNLLHKAVQAGDLQLVEVVLRHMCPSQIHVTTLQSQCTFQFAQANSMVVDRIECDFLGKQDSLGKTALFYALTTGIPSAHAIVHLLVQAMSPADLSLQDKARHTALSYCLHVQHINRIPFALLLIAQMRPEDLIRPHRDSMPYLYQAILCRSLEVASALRERMHPQDFARVAAMLQVVAPDDDWRLLLSPVLLTKGAQE
ncbi:MAG: hypothetical protein KDK78_09715 [Chlamydiia bacterium]|nr:hypothetical protein [Chlamydiia bacterium]